MPHRLLVIEGRTPSSPAQVLETLASDDSFACQRVRWDEFPAQDLERCRDDLIVAVTTEHETEAVAAFERFRQHPFAAPTFAVLPTRADAPLLRLVSTVADDFMFEPIHPVELRHRVGRMLSDPRHELEAVRRQLVEERGLARLVGRDPAFTRAVEKVPRFAAADLPVMITGETGSGKELCARALHHLGPRRQAPFVAVDCGAVPDLLFENELFGHARGAFTDAHRDHKGLVAMAEGGTLFLDEVDALSPGAQAKLLRFLQERTYRALGSGHFDRADVNVVVASNRDLATCVAEQRFRSDLYFRLNVLRIHLPPLRERPMDIALLAYDALKQCRGTTHAPPKAFTRAAIRRLELHDWPGNVRELFNVVQRGVVACEGERIMPCHLELGSRASDDDEHGADFRTERAAAIAAFEQRYVEQLLRKHRGNVTHAAREARQDRRAFGRFIKKYRIDRRSLTE